MQAPLAHVWFTQGWGVPHVPPTHVCTPLPEHSACPTVQTPVHAPEEHMPLAQLTGAPHAPPVHVSTALPEQRVCPGLHTLASTATSAGESTVTSLPLPSAPELEPVVPSSLASGDPVSCRSSMPAMAEQPAPAAPARPIATQTSAPLSTHRL